ncbi:radial spoke 3 [Tribonema minus]|uniref:Radial spoke 3 n=1 Tax=Tribonema minus TaxID=303371 RepID=A0A836CGH7_9STRA|nr:radial spoke 3 [Tribonema minus]
MFDRRVVRGNTYSAQVITMGARREAERLRADQERRMKAEALRRRLEAQARMRPGTPPPASGRTHMDMQTDEFLEELRDRPVEADADTQTDALRDRPASPLFVRAKTGTDAETQVEVGELFDFDAEVEPLLEVLVGKTLELSMLELLEEEELEAVRRRQRAFAAARDAELAEVQRLEAEARRRTAEKQRRLKQAQESRRAREAAAAKVAARSFARTYLSSLNADVFGGLEAEGHFYDPLRREVAEAFMPWLADAGAADAQRAAALRALAERRAAEAAAARAAAEAEAARAAAEAAAAAATAAAAAEEEGGEGGDGGEGGVDED